MTGLEHPQGPELVDAPVVRKRHRLLRWTAGSATLHLTMLTLAVLFVLPFVWMIAVALKTDEEAASTQVFPAIPTFIGKSPYTPTTGPSVARFELRGLQLRSLDGHVQSVPTTWRWISGPGSLRAIENGNVIVNYDFSSPSSEPLVMRCEFDSSVDASELHRLILNTFADASWNRVDVRLDLPGGSFESTSPFYLAQHRMTGAIFQPPTFQDEMLAARNWIDLKSVTTRDREGAIRREASTTPIGGRTAESLPDGRGSVKKGSLTVTLSPSSTLEGIQGKALRNFVRAIRSVPFWTYVGNSLFLVAMQMTGTLFSAAFVGYAFSRLHWPGRGVAMGVLLATMMLPGQVTMVPSFLIWRTLGWYNTLNPLWVPSFLGNAFFIFLMVQHMRTIPKELDEAAKIDGMNSFQTWWYVIVPQVRPTLAAIAILTFMGAWNEFMGPLIMLRDQELFPLSLGLFSMQIDASTDWTLLMAGNLLMVLPVVAVFFLFQRYFVEGVTVSGMKG